jgi:hypothetical protein
MTNPTGLDTETHLIGPGNVIPRFVCVSYTEADGTGIEIGRAHV